MPYIHAMYMEEEEEEGGRREEEVCLALLACLAFLHIYFYFCCLAGMLQACKTSVRRAAELRFCDHVAYVVCCVAKRLSCL